VDRRAGPERSEPHHFTQLFRRMNKRARARQLAQAALARGEPLAWFEELYQEALHGDVPIPWADLCPNPNLIDLTARVAPIPRGCSALKIGCGLDDAEWMESQGWLTTAFDISPTAIVQCRQRFPESGVSYRVADLFSLPREWREAFDVVAESYTLQVLPPELRGQAVAAIAACVRPGGRLLFIARCRASDEPVGEMPWPLTEDEVRSFSAHGLSCDFSRIYLDDETPPVHRIQASFTRIDPAGIAVS
jgi:SAM-dependent methyltransferase